jgi:hypothetical protein
LLHEKDPVSGAQASDRRMEDSARTRNSMSVYL